MSLFKKNPVKKLQQEYERKLVEARDTQRAGDIQGYAERMGEADELLARIRALEESASG